MPPAPEARSEDLWTATIVAAALDRGRMIHLMSMAATMILVLLLIGIAAGFFRVSIGAFWFALALICGALEFWLAARVRFDADLFAAIARNDGDLDSFDRSMVALGLLPPAKAGRPMIARGQGALRLLKLQALAFAAQVAVCLVAALIMSGRALS